MSDLQSLQHKHTSLPVVTTNSLHPSLRLSHEAEQSGL